MQPHPRAAWGGMAAASRVTCRDISGPGDGCGRPTRHLQLVAVRAREAMSVYNSRLRGDVAGMRGRVVGKVRLSGRAASIAGAAASADMSLLTNRCWPCSPVLGKILTGKG